MYLVRTRYGEAAEFCQGVAVRAGWQYVEAGDGAFGEVAGQLRGVVECAGSFDGIADAFEVFQAAFLNRLAHQGGLLGGAFAHGVDQRQGWLAFGQVVADVLAQGRGVATVIEQVVDQLEGDAEVITKGAQGFGLCRIGAGQGGGAVGRG